jgi:hypothetical protein
MLIIDSVQVAPLKRHKIVVVVVSFCSTDNYHFFLFRFVKCRMLSSQQLLVSSSAPCMHVCVVVGKCEVHDNKKHRKVCSVLGLRYNLIIVCYTTCRTYYDLGENFAGVR